MRAEVLMGALASFFYLFTKLSGHELARDKFLVTTIEGQELWVSSSFDNITLLHDDNLVGVDNGTESMSDNDDSKHFFFKQLVESFLHLVLALSIQSASSLVKKQDSRSSDEGTSDCNSLLLATREAASSLTDLGVNTIREKNLIVEESTTRLIESYLETRINFSIA